MSLVNDALKRADQLHKQQGSGTAEVPPLRAVEYPRPSSRLPAILSLVIVALLALAGWFFWQWMKVADRTPAARTPAVASTPVSQPVVPAPAEKVSSVAAVVEAPIAATPEPLPMATEPATPVATASLPVELPPVAPVVLPGAAQAASASTPPVAPVVFPELKVQGIFYTVSNPSALVNGVTVYKGDTVQEVRVVDIQGNKVIVELRGQRKTLVMAQ